MRVGGGAPHATTPREVAHREKQDQGDVSERVWEYWAEGPISGLATYVPPVPYGWNRFSFSCIGNKWGAEKRCRMWIVGCYCVQ